MPDDQRPQRLQRYLASAGFGSRRQCEDLIESGRVMVNDQTVTRLGTKIDPSSDQVSVDAVPVKAARPIYYAVNKPTGVVTTNRDPHGRPRVIDLVPPDDRVFPVGRLDMHSEGLILLTNDGDLAQRLAHPRFGVAKVYRVTVAGKVDGETMKQMRQGIHIAEGLVRVEGARILKSRSRATELEITLKEGKNREIRRILARLGHKVVQLRRVAIGPLRLGDLPSGAYRPLRRDEVNRLCKAMDSAGTESKLRRRGSKKASRRPKSGYQKRDGATPSGKPTNRASGKPPRSPSKRSEGIVIGGEDSGSTEKSHRATNRSGRQSRRPKRK